MNQTVMPRPLSSFVGIKCKPAIDPVSPPSQSVRLKERKAVSPYMEGKAVMRLPQVMAALGVSRSTLYLKMDPKSKYYDTEFPMRIKLGAKAIGWIEDEILNYIEILRDRRIGP